MDGYWLLQLLISLFISSGLEMSFCGTWTDFEDLSGFRCYKTVAWNPVQISLSCMFPLLRKLGLAALSFKLVPS